MEPSKLMASNPDNMSYKNLYLSLAINQINNKMSETTDDKIAGIEVMCYLNAAVDCAENDLYQYMDEDVRLKRLTNRTVDFRKAYLSCRDLEDEPKLNARVSYFNEVINTIKEVTEKCFFIDKLGTMDALNAALHCEMYHSQLRDYIERDDLLKKTMYQYSKFSQILARKNEPYTGSDWNTWDDEMSVFSGV